MSIETIKQSRFFKPIYKAATKKRRVRSVMFELTYRCNFKCPHCYADGSPREKSELGTAQVFTILDQLRDMGVFNIAFTGGEALLRKDIFDILTHAKGCGFRTALLSNGYLIDKRVARELARANVNNVDVTLNSLKPKVFERLTGMEDSLGKVKSAINLLIKYGIRVKIKSTGMTINRDELVRISNYARSLNIIYNLDTEILPCRNGCVKAVEDYSLRPDEIYVIRRMVYPEMFSGKKRKTGPRRRHGLMFKCGVGKTSFSITPYGKMNFCLEIDYPSYDIPLEGVRSCWEKLKTEVDRLNRIPDFDCKVCDLIKYCGWCPGRSYIETGAFNRCSEYFKKMAVEAKRRREKDGREKNIQEKQ